MRCCKQVVAHIRVLFVKSTTHLCDLCLVDSVLSVAYRDNVNRSEAEARGPPKKL